MDREAIRVQQPDGSFKIIFREKSKEQQSGPVAAAKQEPKENKDQEKHAKQKKVQDPRYYNPMNQDHIDIFGKDLLNRDLIFSLNSGESIKGKMTGYAQYEILIEFDGKKVILMKQAIAKVEVL